LPGDDGNWLSTSRRQVWQARAELALAQSEPELALRIVDQLMTSAANLEMEILPPPADPGIGGI
jgi:hypothetical protein